jgi:hypothetical protein
MLKKLSSQHHILLHLKDNQTLIPETKQQRKCATHHHLLCCCMSQENFSWLSLSEDESCPHLKHHSFYGIFRTVTFADSNHVKRANVRQCKILSYYGE